jgi:hypothetical protein
VYGQHQDVSAHHPTHLGTAVREKKKRQYKMRTHSWFNPDLVSFKHYKLKVSCPCKEYIRVSQSKLTNSWVQYWVNQLVTKHLSAQGRLNPKGGLHCFWYPNKTWTPPIDAYGTLKPIKNHQKWNRIENVTSLHSTRGQ